MTFAELIIALALLTVVALTVAGFLLSLLQSSGKSQDLSVGTRLAEQKLEQHVAAGLYLASSAGAENLYTHDAETRTTFAYRLDSTLVTLPGGSPRAGYFVEARVWWWSEEPGQTRSGSGRLSTSVGRLVVP